MITMPVYIHIKCPYCGHTNKVAPAEVPNANQMVTLCYPDDGGCDRHFAFRVQVQYKIQSYTMTRQGE